MLILTWSWCWDNSPESAAQNASCSLRSALEHYSQCSRVCFAALDDRDACPKAGLMGGPGHLIQIHECTVKARRKLAANGHGRLGPGDFFENHRGTVEEQVSAIFAQDIETNVDKIGNTENQFNNILFFQEAIADGRLPDEGEDDGEGDAEHDAEEDEGEDGNEEEPSGLVFGTNARK